MISALLSLSQGRLAVQLRRVAAAAQAELCNRALRRFVELLFEETEGGLLPNLGVDGRILIPTPWSRTRHGAYGLTDHGSRVLRAIVVQQLEALPAERQLLLLERGRWHLNLTYGSQGAALGWLHWRPVTADLWIRCNDGMARRGGR